MIGWLSDAITPHHSSLRVGTVPYPTILSTVDIALCYYTENLLYY